MASVAVTQPLRSVSRFEVADVPVGKALILTGSIGIGDALKSLVATKVPSTSFQPAQVRLAVGLGLAWALLNVRMLRNLLGADIAQLASLGIAADSINDYFQIGNRVTNFINNIIMEPNPTPLPTTPQLKPRALMAPAVAKPSVQHVPNDMFTRF